jgi:nitroreductase
MRKEKEKMDVIEAIMGRRSIRKYKNTPIPKEDLNAILEALRGI